jgi:cold shock CspA family protein
VRSGRLTALRQTFGFIIEEEYGCHLFFHKSFMDNSKDSQFENLAVGHRVTFILGTSERGLCATNVRAAQSPARHLLAEERGHETA